MSFIEVKKISEDLEVHQEQLLKEGSWDQRKFYAIDLIQQDIEDIAQKFIDFLSKESIQSGHAISTAEEIYKGRIREIEIKKNMPRAWNKLVSEPDELLVELLGETLEKISSFKPDSEYIKEFLKKNLNRIIISDSPRKSSPTLLSIVHSTTTSINPGTFIQSKQVYPKDFPPEGTLCRFEYKGRVYEGIIKNGQLHVNGIGAFSSFSSASRAVTNTSRNGWRDWELKLPNTTDWILADMWRKRGNII